MATPLRKEHPEFDDEQEITTADLAQGKRPVSETRGPQEITTERDFEQGSRTENAATLTANDSRVAVSRTTGSTQLGFRTMSSNVAFGEKNTPTIRPIGLIAGCDCASGAGIDAVVAIEIPPPPKRPTTIGAQYESVWQP